MEGPDPGQEPADRPVEGQGLRFQARLRDPRRRSARAARTACGSKADAVTFLVTAATSHAYCDITADASAACEKTLFRLDDADYASPRRRHETMPAR